MNAKGLIALALAAVIGGRAWSQDSSNPSGSDPYGKALNDGADGDPMPGDDSGTSEAPKDPYDLEGALDPYPVNPYAPRAHRYGGATSNGVDTATAPAPKNPYQVETAPNPYSPNPYASSYDAPGGASPFGVGPGYYGEGSTPSEAGKTGAKPLNGDPLGILGFNPYDPQSLLAPKSHPPGAMGTNPDPFGSTNSSPGQSPSLETPAR